MKIILILLLVVSCGKDPVKKTVIKEAPAETREVLSEPPAYPVCMVGDPCRSGCSRNYLSCTEICSTKSPITAKQACLHDCELSEYECLKRSCVSMCDARDFEGAARNECAWACYNSL